MFYRPSLSLAIAALLSTPLLVPAATVTTFTGGDVGEGLDLDGTFVYALDTGGAGGQTVRDAVFTNAATTTGVTLVNAQANFPGMAVSYGASTDDDQLESVINPGILLSNNSNDGGLSNFSFRVDMANLTIGMDYKLQALFHEFGGYTTAGSRVTNVSINSGANIQFDAPGLGSTSTNGVGVVVMETFTAASTTASVFVAYNNVDGVDQPALSAITLEVIPEPASLALLMGGGLFMGVRRKKS